MNLHLLHIKDKADKRSDFFAKNGGNACQMSKNLMKALFIDDNNNLHHWSKEFANAYQDILNTTVKNDDKSNSKRERYLRVLLITGPLGDDSVNEYLHYFLGAADNAFADEDVVYNYNLLKEELLSIRSDIQNLYNFIIDNQNMFFPELRIKIYELIGTISGKIDGKFKRN